MKQVLAIAASNKKVSINRTLLLFAADKLKHVRVNIFSLSEIELPVYNEETESKTGIPEPVTDIYRRFIEVDGFMIACPEHNGLPPAGFKNLIDWLSRFNQLVFQQKPVMLLSASPGKNGGASNLKLLKELLPRWGGEPTGLFSLGDFYRNFSCEDMQINDSSIESKLTSELHLFETSLMHDLQTVWLHS